MRRGSKANPPLSSTPNSTPSKSSLKSKSGSGNSSLCQSRGKSQSQEDLTKPKERVTTKSKYGIGNSSTPLNSRRTPGGAKEPTMKSTERTREKSKPPTTKSSSSSASSSGRNSAMSTRRVSKPKNEMDRTSLETKIKDLMSLAKNKDSEIRSLKNKLDQMMVLLRTQGDDDFESNKCSSPKFKSLAKLPSLDDDDVTKDVIDDVSSAKKEVVQLQDENLKLREQVDAMMLSMRQKEEEKLLFSHNRLPSTEMDTISNDDGLSSLLDDFASGSTDAHFHSASISRSTSTENLLHDENAVIQTSSNLQDRVIPDDCKSECSTITVACLTERIHRMEESHISTSEELEATVQELTDLQKSVPELTVDNDRLQREKKVLLDKLKRAEKKLTENNSEVSHLRALVSDHFKDDSSRSDLKQQYFNLLQEREHLLRIQEEGSTQKRMAEEERKEAKGLADAFKERLRHLERELHKSNTEKTLMEKKLKEANGKAEEHQSEAVLKLEGELHQERLKVNELLKAGQEESTKDVNENIMEYLDSLRSEKQDLEEKTLILEEDFNQVQNENEKLDAKVAELEEEVEACKSKTKKDLSELSELIDRLQEDLRIKQESLNEASETLFVMGDSVEQHIAVKKHDNHTIQQLQNQISGLKEERFRLEKEIQQLKKEQRNQSEEWKQFQSDLQMAVVIANDMKAETQAEVLRLREENQILDENVTKLRVENDQLRRKRISNVSATSSAILEAAAIRQGVQALRETYKRRTSENSPGVQSLIKSFDNNTATEGTSSGSTSPTGGRPENLTPSTPTEIPPSMFVAPKPLGLSTPKRSGASPITATVSPIQRHQSMSSLSSMTSQSNINPTLYVAKMTNSNTASNGSSKPGTPDGVGRNMSGTDLSQLSSLLRRNSGVTDTRKPLNDGTRNSAADILDRLGSSTNPPKERLPPTPINPSAKRNRIMSTPSTPSGNTLASLARRYGGSKRNALLKWCQEKTEAYQGIDITNFSSSWTDGLALCSLLHSYLPAHIPYDALEQAYVDSSDDKAKKQLQAKHFRLAFAAAESVGIEPVLSVEEMIKSDRPDWHRVMSYVTEIFKYFET